MAVLAFLSFLLADYGLVVSRFFHLMKGPASGSSSCVRTVSESVLRVMVFLSSCPSVWGCGSCDKAGSLWKLKVWQRVEPPMHVLPLSLLVFRYDHAVLRLGLTRSAERTGKEEMVVIDGLQKNRFWRKVVVIFRKCFKLSSIRPLLMLCISTCILCTEEALQGPFYPIKVLRGHC